MTSESPKQGQAADDEPTGPAPTPADIEAAARRLAGQIERTPLARSRTLSEITGAEIWLKFENLQYTASFKERGAFNKLVQLAPDEQGRGVIAMSAGNHAQGVAYHAGRLGFPATIVMPCDTPAVKIENTRKLGAEVVLEGGGLDEAAAFANALAAERGLVFVHPYDDPAIIAGQGTVALEILEDGPEFDALLIPLGGGGLTAGMAIAAKARRPEIEILAVEAALYPSFHRRMKGLPPAAGGPTIAEGIAVKTPGRITLPVIEKLVGEILLVEEADIEAAVLRLLEIEKTVVEGAGAIGLAAVMAAPDRFRGRRLCIVLSGGNIDMRLLSGVIIRGLVRSERLIRLRVGLPDSPGSLARLAQAIGDAGGNVVDVEHRRAFSRRGLKEADVDLTIETRNEEHARNLLQQLGDGGFNAMRLDDRLA
jgi:threonine dehydratase